MIEHYVVPINSSLWWNGLIASALFIISPIALAKFSGEKFRYIIGKALGILLVSISISIHVYMIQKGIWNIKSALPLQLCAISSWLSGLAFFIKSQLLFECLIYWGLAGAVHSFITPEMTLGNHPYTIFEYYASHAGIILSALYLIIINKQKVRVHSWFRVFLYTQIVMLTVGAINLFIHSNYMYLCNKPAADNPFIIGDWPYYILVLEFVALAHFALIYLGLRVTGSVQTTSL